MRDPRDVATKPSTEEGAGFYRRWSRRKARVRVGAPEPDPVAEAPASESAPAARTETAAPADPDGPDRVLTDADMPALDTLNSDSDFSPFMSPGVSDALRRVALRKFFHSSEFNVLDGLDDYCEDFTTWEPLGDVVTAEMRFRAGVAAERARAKAEAALEQEAGRIRDEVLGTDAASSSEAPPAGEPGERDPDEPIASGTAKPDTDAPDADSRESG